MVRSGIRFVFKRSGLAAPFLYLLFMSCALAVATCGSEAMSDGASMSQVSHMKMGVANTRRELANNTTVSSCTS